jgi:hypothetical protein
MAPSKSPVIRLLHIIEEAEAINRALDGVLRMDFEDSWVLQRAASVAFAWPNRGLFNARSCAPSNMAPVIISILQTASFSRFRAGRSIAPSNRSGSTPRAISISSAMSTASMFRARN